MHARAPPGAPANVYRGVPLADRSAAVTQNLTLLGGIVDRRAVMRGWELTIAVPPWDRAPVWLHGDLHPANILVHRGHISAVIDFGDITSGDPAADLSVAWMLLPADCRDVFRDAYGRASGHPASDNEWGRARGWALALSLAFLAHSADNRLLAHIGNRTINAVLA